MTSAIRSFGNLCMQSFPVLVECSAYHHGMNGSFDVVGLPDAAVRESRERVRSALTAVGFDFPSDSRITVNLSPADMRKEGAVYDLPILLAVLTASEQISLPTDDAAFIGEITLQGDILPVRGVLSMALEARKRGIKRLFVPKGNAAEASVADGQDVYPVDHIMQLLDVLSGKRPMDPVKMSDFSFDGTALPVADLADVRGQEPARRALEVAAAGGHNILMIGAPGSGKSMLAKRMPSILPDMTFEESLETTKIHSIAGTLPQGLPLITVRPFRSPHHTVSPAALAGGGKIPRPGEISLSHNGVLFLDELPEFRSDAMEVLRQPLEDGVVTVSRVAGSFTFPSTVLLIAAMNPCKCGYYGHPTRKCTCSPQSVQHYLSRVSGPLLDRIDIQVETSPVPYDDLSSQDKGESSQAVRERVNKARKRQQERYRGQSFSCNAHISPALLRDVCPLTEEADSLLRKVFTEMEMSARGYDRVMKVARTLADLDGCDVITGDHIMEAVQYRKLDRKFWG